MSRSALLTPATKLFRTFSLASKYAERAKQPSSGEPLEITRRWQAGVARDNRRKFAAGVRQRRQALSLTQEELARYAGLSVPDVAEAEAGESLPSEDTAVRLCWALDTTVPKPMAA